MQLCAACTPAKGTRLLAQVGLLAFRDPFGIRPLVLGYRTTSDGNEWCFASEDCAFGPLGFVKARAPKPPAASRPSLPHQHALRTFSCCAFAGDGKPR